MLSSANTNLVPGRARVTYLTGFTPYWSDGLLPGAAGAGAPVFATALLSPSGFAGPLDRPRTNPLSENRQHPQAGPPAMGARSGGRRLRPVGSGRVAGIGSAPGAGPHMTRSWGAAPAVGARRPAAARALCLRCASGIDGAERGLIARADAPRGCGPRRRSILNRAADCPARARGFSSRKEARLRGAEGSLHRGGAGSGGPNGAHDPGLGVRFAACRSFSRLRAFHRLTGQLGGRRQPAASPGTRRVARRRAGAPMLGFGKLTTSIRGRANPSARKSARMFAALPWRRPHRLGWRRARFGSYPPASRGLVTPRADHAGVPDGGLPGADHRALRSHGTRWLGAEPVFV